MDRLRGQRYLVVVVVGNYWFAALDLRDWLPSRHAPQGSLLPSNPYRPPDGQDVVGEPRLCLTA